MDELLQEVLKEYIKRAFKIKISLHKTFKGWISFHKSFPYMDMLPHEDLSMGG